jgi:hypothetical protein
MRRIPMEKSDVPIGASPPDRVMDRHPPPPEEDGATVEFRVA